MLISAIAALAMFAAPQTPQGADAAPKAGTKVAGKKVCTRTVLPGSNLPTRVCTTVTPKPAPKERDVEKGPTEAPTGF